MPYTCSHTTPYVMLPTRYRAVVVERCIDRIRQTAIINLSSMLGSGCTVRVSLVAGVRTICPVSGRYLGRAEGVRKNPPPSSALLACLPKPQHLVWLKSGSGQITTYVLPFSWLIFTFVPNGPFSRIFHPPPSCGRGVLAPILHPFCTLCAPPFLR